MTRHLKIFLIPVLLGFGQITMSRYQADDITGIWFTPENQSKVKIYKKNGKYYGKLVWVEKTHDKNGKLLTDVKNPDEKLRNRPYTGMEFMYHFEFNGNDKWENGKIYNAQDGRTYSAYLQLIDKNTLKVRGYIGVEWIGGNSIWKRAG